MPKRTPRGGPPRGRRPWLIPALLAVLVVALLVTGFYAYQVWLDLTRLPTSG